MHYKLHFASSYRLFAPTCLGMIQSLLLNPKKLCSSCLWIVKSLRSSRPPTVLVVVAWVNRSVLLLVTTVNKFGQSNLGRGPRRGAVAHNAVKSPLVTMARPKFGPKSTPSRGSIRKLHYLPHAWPMIPNGIRIQSAVLPQCTGHTDRPTDARTYGPTNRQIVHGKIWRI